MQTNFGWPTSSRNKNIACESQTEKMACQRERIKLYFGCIFVILVMNSFEVELLRLLYILWKLAFVCYVHLISTSLSVRMQIISIYLVVEIERTSECFFVLSFVFTREFAYKQKMHDAVRRHGKNSNIYSICWFN